MLIVGQFQKLWELWFGLGLQGLKPVTASRKERVKTLHIPCKVS